VRLPQQTRKIWSIGQPLKIAIEWQPEGNRYERTGFTESL